MIRQAVDTLVAELGTLSPEQAVHAAAARRVADVMEGEDAPLYALPGLARELRNAVAALTGAPQVGQGITDEGLERLLGGLA